jgi:hypothetical protein
MILDDGDDEGVARVSGRPRRIASVAAKEKFSNAVALITVDARQRLKAFRTLHTGELESSRGRATPALETARYVGTIIATTC